MGGCPEESSEKPGRTFLGTETGAKSVDFIVDGYVMQGNSRVVSWNECVLPSW
jgi:hypothetical protein